MSAKERYPINVTDLLDGVIQFRYVHQLADAHEEIVALILDESERRGDEHLVGGNGCNQQWERVHVGEGFCKVERLL